MLLNDCPFLPYVAVHSNYCMFEVGLVMLIPEDTSVPLPMMRSVLASMQTPIVKRRSGPR
jgi:hypothetical protein